jgi:hypothetical protein
MEEWVICLGCDRVIDKIVTSPETHGRLVHKAIDRHRSNFSAHASYRVIPSPKPTLLKPKKSGQTIDQDGEEE